MNIHQIFVVFYILKQGKFDRLKIQVDTVVNWARPAKFILCVLIVSICAD